MPGDDLDQYFESYIEEDSIFQDKQYVQSNYVPGDIDHRDDQMDTIAQIMAPALRKQRPSNLFVYGKTGTGKTMTCRYIAGQMRNVAEQQDIPLKILYLNCKLKKIADTEYRLIAELARMFGEDVPSTGLPTDEVYNKFFDALENEDKVVIAILDEIDQLVRKAGDEIIYNLTRINSELDKAKLSIVGISNDLMFANNLDPRVKSSLSEEEIVFPPYNAIEIQQILRDRAQDAFAENVLEEGVIPKCAAYAAREHGDARRALELLRVAGELAERGNQTKVAVDNIDQAEHKIERDRLIDMVKTQPTQFQATLYPILEMSQKEETPLNTGEIYELYKQLCDKAGLRPLTQRRISDIIGELDMFGVINANVISKGRFGRTREIEVSLTSKIEDQIVSILKTELDING